MIRHAFHLLTVLALVCVGCGSRESKNHAALADGPAATATDKTIAARVIENQSADLFRQAKDSLDAGDSLAFVRCLLRIVDRPLGDSLLFEVGGLVGLGYRMSRVTDNVVADYAPRFFPDGKRIVYFSRLQREQLEYPGLRSVRCQTQICAIGIDGNDPAVISDGKASEFFPDVSSDARYVVCQRAEGDTLKGEWTAAAGSILYVYDLQGNKGRQFGGAQQTAEQPRLPLGRLGRRQRLGDAELYARWPRFMPHSAEVLFVTSQRGFAGLMSTINIETAEITMRYRSPRLDRSGESYFPFLPSPFFDGSHIAFQSGLAEEKAVFVCDSLGQDMIRLTPEGLSERHPSPAPDNRTVVFVSDGRDGEELFLRHIGDTIRRQITFDGDDKQFPAYSPDGQLIAFGAKKRGFPEADYEIFLLDLSQPVGRKEIVTRVKELARRVGVLR